MASHLVNILDLTHTENNTEVELIQENGKETNVEQFQHFWPMHCMVPPTTTIPPLPRKIITMCKKPLSKQIANQRRVAKAFLQNKQLRRANKKHWSEDIAYIRNLFAPLKVRNNPICLDSKLGEWKHNALYERITFMWEKMIPWDLASYIRLPGIFEKLDNICVKENSAINLVVKYMKDGHPDNEIKSLIAINHNFYRLIFSNACNMIYFNTSECYILNNFLSNFQSWKHTKDIERRNFFSASSLATNSRHADPVLVVSVIKTEPGLLTEAKNREILKNQKNKERKKMLKRQLHEMNEQEFS